MTHEDALFQDILNHRDDDAPRRVYADWLLDRGDPVGAARGEFIQVQCTLAALPPGVSRPADLVARERELLEGHRREWGSPFQRLGCVCWEYRRGFVEGVGLPASGFLTQGAALARLAPVRQLKLYNAGPVFAAVLASAHLGRIETLDLEGNDLGDPEARTLAAAPHLGRLATLLLWANHLGDAGVAALAASDALPALRRFDLSANLVGDAGVSALAGSRLLSRLAVLDLSANQVRDAGGLALAQSAFTGGLRWLDLGKNPIGPDAQSALRERFVGRVHVWG